jgi:hypothetical protein
MAQSEDTPEGDGTSGTKPSFELFETTAGGRLLRGSDGKGGTTEICLRRPTCTRWRDRSSAARSTSVTINGGARICRATGERAGRGRKPERRSARRSGSVVGPRDGNAELPGI